MTLIERPGYGSPTRRLYLADLRNVELVFLRLASRKAAAAAAAFIILTSGMGSLFAVYCDQLNYRFCQIVCIKSIAV